MKKASWVVLGFGIGGIGFGLLCFVGSGCGRALGQGTIGVRATPPDADKWVELTVYKQDFAMVHEHRSVAVAAGANHLRLEGVSHELDPNSVMFQTGRGLDVVGSTYDLGVSSSEDLYKRLAGRPVELIWPSDTGREGDRLRGVLEPTGGGFMIRTDKNAYINPKGTLVAATDEASATQPGLAVQVQSEAAGPRDLSFSYLTRGLSWSADYVGHLASDADTMDLECWASVTNSTGIPFRDAKVTFVAGEPNRAVVEGRARFPAKAMGRISDVTAGEAMPKPELPPATAVGELYEYPAAGPASIGIDQMSRIRMFEGATIPIRRDYNVRLPGLSADGYDAPTSRISAVLSVAFDNRKSGGLGLPLPAGDIRVFDSDKLSERYVGAAALPDLPVDAPASLTLSTVFDVSAEPAVVASRRRDRHTMTKTMRVVLRNGKPQAVTIRVVQGVDGRWSFASGEKPERLDASTAQWKIVVPANGVRVLTSSLDLYR